MLIKIHPRIKRVVTVRRVLILKCTVASGILVNHFWPGTAGLITNLIWLFAF